MRALWLALLLLLAACAELHEDEQPTRFWAEGPTIYMTGTIHSRTPSQLAAALRAHPEAREIVMLEVPGSANDDANLRAARLVRGAGLDTRLVAGSLIASGGTDFFLAGVRRTAAPGAQVGVHSWSTLGGDEGAALPVDAHEHDFYLDFYREMGVPEGFYWFTLYAAPPEGMHWLTRGEMARYGVVSR